jgi:glycosyltransferase involved in cell wall biosynthesis
MSRRPSSSLLISTYNAPLQLELVLRSALAQKKLPDEILIADDGSTNETQILIETIKRESPIPIIHVWHEDKGFRKSIILNKTITKAKGDYLIQIDGDCILHPSLIKDHLRFARVGYYQFGSRIRIPYPQKTIRSIRIPYATLLQKPITFGVKKFRGCNASFWKSDIHAINGYNEAMKGWGCEDSELIIRLQNKGIKGRRLRHCGLVYHMDHPTACQKGTSDNQLIEQDAIDKKLVTCALGLNQYL